MCDSGDVLNSNDSDINFLSLVRGDLNHFLNSNAGRPKRVLAFPALNSTRRYQIHKLISENYKNLGLSSFSIGDSASRKLIVALETDFVRPLATVNKLGVTMEQEQKTRTSGRDTRSYVYVPPPARKEDHNSGTTPKLLPLRINERRLNGGGASSKNVSEIKKKVCEDSSLLFLRQSHSSNPVQRTEKRKKKRSKRSKESVSSAKTLQPEKECGVLLPCTVGPTDSDTTDNSGNEIPNTLVFMSSCSDIDKGKHSCSVYETSLSHVEENFSGLTIKDSEKDFQIMGHDRNLGLNDCLGGVFNEEQFESHENKSVEQNYLKHITSVSENVDLDIDFYEVRFDKELIINKKKKDYPQSYKNDEEETDLNQRDICDPSSISSELLKSSEQLSPSSVVDTGNANKIESVNAELHKDKFIVETGAYSSLIQQCEDKTMSVVSEDSDWETLYDDDGVCLKPELMPVLNDIVGPVKILRPASSYKEFQSLSERDSEGCNIVEVYDFPSEFKTKDLMSIFTSYVDKGLYIKWVDDTHALAVFPSSLMADEVLTIQWPFVKIRPLRLALTASKEKAKSITLPPALRPKTHPGLARRLVTGALGLRMTISSSDREEERKILNEAREQRRLATMQRNAAWEGTLGTTPKKDCGS